MQSMENAPTDQEIMVLGPDGWKRCYFLDCAWLREGDYAEDIPDCWRPVDLSNDIELGEARGWKPTN